MIRSGLIGLGHLLVSGPKREASQSSGFVMILGHSRTKYIEFVKRCDLRSMERCMLNAFQYFGGIPKEVLTDNMKTVVAGCEAGKVIWNTQFDDFAVEMGFIPKVCQVRTPQTKGKVKRFDVVSF